jgi:hypothetical protein
MCQTTTAISGVLNPQYVGRRCVLYIGGDTVPTYLIIKKFLKEKSAYFHSIYLTTLNVRHL